MGNSQTTNTLVGDAQPNYTELPDQFFDSYVVEQYRSYLPKEDQAVYSPWARSKMLTDDKYLTGVVNNMYNSAIETEPELAKQYEDDPDKLKEDQIRIKNNIYQSLAKEVFQGEDVNKAIQNRESSLLYNGVSNINDIAISSVLENHKDKYKELGFLDSEGNRLLDNEALRFKVLQDEELVKNFTGDFYNDFHEQLTKQHNTGAIDTENVDQMSQAFVAYKEFGKEGLTNYINYVSEYNPNLPLEEQTPSAKKAYDFVAKSKKGGKSIREHINEFYGSEDSPAGKFTVTLPKKSKEMLEDIKRDWTPYTHAMNYAFDSEEEAVKNFIKQTREKPEEFSWERFMGSTLEKMGLSVPHTLYSDQFKNSSDTRFYNYESGKEATILGSIAGLFSDEETYHEASVDDIFASIENGTYDHNYRNYIYNIVDEAEKGELFDYSDIMRSVLLHATPNNSIAEEMGADMSKRDLYTIDYGSAPTNIKAAVDALKHSYGNVVRQGRTSDEYIIEPNYSERLNKTSWLSNQLRSNVEYEFKPTYDEQGNISGGQVVPADNFLQSTLFGKILTATGENINPLKMSPLQHGFLGHFVDWVDKSIYDPTHDAIEQTIRENNLEDSMVGKGFFAWKRSYQQTVEQALDVEPRNELASDGAQYMAGQMGAYLWSSYAIGKAGLSQLGKVKAFNQLSDFTKFKNAQQVLSYMKPKSYTKIGNIAESLSKVGRGLAGAGGKGIGTYAKIELGEIIRQPITPPEFSLFQLGKVSEKYLGTDTGYITKNYNRSNRLAQIGADMIGNGLLSVAFDNILAGTRFSVNKLGMKLGIKKTGRGVKLNNAGEFQKLTKQQYTLDTGYSPDMRRFWRASLDEVNEMPQGNIEETLKNFYSGRNVGALGQNSETFTDIVQRFKEDGDLYMDGLHDNIKNTLKEYDNHLGGSLSRNRNLDTRASEIMNNTLDYVADELYHGMKEASDETMPLRFAQTLKNAKSTSEYIPFVIDGKKNYKMSLDNAQALNNLKSYSTIIKNNDGTYGVSAVKPNYWGIQLGNKIQLKYMDAGFKESLDSYLKSLDLDGLSIQKGIGQKIERQQNIFNRFYDKTVTIGNKRGVVTGLNEDRAIITFADGTNTTIKRVEIEDQVRNVEQYTEEAQNIKQQAKQNKTEDIKKKEEEEVTEEFKETQKQKAKNTKTDKLNFKETLREKDSTFRKYGITSNFWDGLKKTFNYKKRGKASVRKVLSSMGHSGAIDYQTVGVNKASIQYLDIKKVKESGLPKNTVFKIKSADGLDEHYITTEKVSGDKFSPGLWTTVKGEKGLVMNPSIRRIEANQTFIEGQPILYVPKEFNQGGNKVKLFIPAKKGEEGVIINVQKPISASEDITRQKVLEKNIDSISFDVNGKKAYRLINEMDQVVEPSKFKGSGNDAIVKQIIERPIPSRKEIEKFLENTSVIKELGKANVAVAPAIGYVADIMESYWQDEPFDYDLTVAGLLFSTGKYALKNSGFLDGTLRQSAKNIWDRNLAPLFRASENNKKNTKRMGLGVDDNMSEPVSSDWVDQISNIMGLAGSGASSIAKAVTRNNMTESMFSMMRRLNISKADEMLNALMSIDSTINKIFSNPERRFQTAVFEHQAEQLSKQRGIPIQEAKELIDPEDIRNQWNKFIYDDGSGDGLGEGPRMVKDFLEAREGGVISDKYIQDQFNASFHRILDSGATKPDHLLGRMKNKAVRAMYQRSYGDALRALDRHLLDQEKFEMLVQAQRTSYDDVLDRWTSALDEFFQRRYGQIAGSPFDNAHELSDMAQRFYGERLTPNKFKKLLREQEKSVKDIEKDLDTFSQLRQLPEWGDVEYANHAARKMTDLRGKYSPHVYGKNAELRTKKNFIQRNSSIKAEFSHLSERVQQEYVDSFPDKTRVDIIKENPLIETELSNLSKTGQDNAWDNEVVRLFIEANSDDDKLHRLKEQLSSGEMEDAFYKTEEEATAKLNQLKRDLNSQGYYQEAERIVREGVPTPTQLTIDGKQVDGFVIELPDDLAYGIRGVNRKTLSKYYTNFFESIKAPKSNHLDRPRVSNIPYELRELDIDRLRHRYSRDTGRRIHGAENSMMNTDEAGTYYINDIIEQLRKKGDIPSKKLNEYRVRLRDTFNIAFGNVGEDMDSFTKLGQKGLGYSIYRNLQFLRFGYGFGPYNLFEWAVVGSHIGGGIRNVSKTLFTTDRTRAQNFEDLLEHENIFRRMIQYARPEFQEFGVYDYGLDDLAAKVEYKSSSWANALGDFSARKLYGVGNAVKQVHGTIPATRLIPLVGDSFLGSSMFASSMISRASLGDAMYLADLLKQVKNIEADEAGVKMISARGRKYSQPEIERLLEDLGIVKSKQDKFIEGNDTFRRIVDRLDNDPNFSSEIGNLKHPSNVDPETKQATSDYMDMVIDVVRSATQSYNGVNRLYRPELWHSNIGRSLSMYSTYPFNAGLQITQRRIREPLRKWFDIYGSTIRDSKTRSVMELWFNIQTGNTSKLIDKGYSKEAIENFPTEATHAILRTFASFGITIPGYMSIEALKDVVDYGLSPIVQGEAEFSGDWERFTRETIINPMAPKEEQVTLMDIAREGEMSIDELHSLITHSLANLGRMGAVGRWLEPVSNTGLQYYGVGSLSPPLGDLDTLTRMSGRLVNTDPSNYQEKTPNYLMKELLNYTPVLGSSIFSKTRNSIIDEYFKKDNDSTVNGELLL